jgi:hypothetical protein
MRKTCFGAFLFLVLGCLLAVGCALRSTGDTGLVHVVLYRIKPDAPPGTREEIRRDVEALLAGLPSVRGLWLGTPAATKKPDRPMVHDDYDLGLVVLFDDLQDLEAYLAHPDHVVFAERHDPRCELRVFDVEDVEEDVEKTSRQ